MLFIRFLGKYELQVYAILRIIAGFLFLWHGSQKLFNFPTPFVPPGGPLPVQVIIAGIIEFIGGILIMIGLWTRWAAAICAIIMAVVYVSDLRNAFLPLMNNGELSLLYFFVFLFFLIRGAGTWGIDNLKRKNIPGQLNHSDIKDIPVH